MKREKIDIAVALAQGGAFRLDVATGAFAAVHGGGGPAGLLSAALAAAPARRGARVLAVSPDFFSQVVRLPARQVDGLSADELRSALLYEIEPFSNMSRDGAASAFEEIREGSADGARSWRAVQVPLDEYASLDAAARAAGARLAGCAAAWGAPASDDEWAAALGRAVSEVTATPRLAPVAAPADTASKKRRAAFWSIAFAAAAAAACAIHFAVVSHVRSVLRAEVEEREILAAANDRIVSGIRSAASRREAIAREAAARARAEEELRLYGGAWGSLLRELPAACGDEVMVRALSGDLSKGAVVEAVAVGAEAPEECMTRLAGPAAAHGWRLEPREVRAAGDSGPASFSFAMLFAPPAQEGGAR